MFDPTPALRSSLTTTAGKPVPLKGVAVAGTVLGAHGRLTVRQRYENEEKSPIEAVYTFPLPSDAVLVGFAMECDGRRVEGVVKEREEAFQEYDDAIAKGHGAALLDQERKNVFTASVGNLLPGEETVVEVTYVQRLGADEGALRLMIPTLVAPRYMPGAPSGDRTAHGTAEPTTRVPDADRISPAIAAVSYGLSLDVLFDLGRALTVESPSHPLSVQKDGEHRVRVSMKSEEVPLDRDVVILASGVGRESAGVVADRTGGKEGTFALTVVPDLFQGERADARDVVFVVDVSGSMAGDSIDQARSAMRLCLRHLAEGDRFNVIAFSTTFRSFEPVLVPFTQRTLEAADRFIAGLAANGGTEMLEPLLAAAAALADGRRDGLVVLLTDGQVGNEAEIVAQVTAKLGRVRVYGFGIGTSVSDLLLRELGRRSKGASEFIHPGERIDEKVTAQFARATAARVEGLTLKLVDVDGGELSPAELPALVDGEPWVVYGRYEKACVGRAELRGTLRGAPWFLQVPVDLSADEARPELASLWAASRVRDLEDGEEGISGRRAEAQKKRIVALAIEHGVASKYTSFVVVEKRSGERRSHGMPETRAVPVNAPAGWAMMHGSQPQKPTGMPPGGVMRAFAMAAPAPMSPMPMSPMRRSAPKSAGYGAPPPQQFGQAPPPPPGAARPPAPPRAIAPAEERAKEGGGFGAAIGGAVDKLLGRSESVSHATGAPASPSQGEVNQEADSIQRLFERQLASGLWEGDADTDAARLLATARALALCFAGGVDTAHSLFGAPLKKAIGAIRALAESLAKKGDGERELMAALVAAYLVASGSRLRAQLLDVVRGSASERVKGLAAHLTDNRVAMKRLAELDAG